MGVLVLMVDVRPSLKPLRCHGGEVGQLKTNALLVV